VIPAENVTILGGDGGTGKSQIAFQLAHSVASGTPWLGFEVEKGKALYLSAEDEMDELHRRLNSMGADFASLPDLLIAPMAGKDALLAAPGAGRDALLAPTDLFDILIKRIAEYRPSLLVLDTLADLFGGNEIIRHQVRKFISMLRGLAFEFRVTVILLAHPSQSGMARGDGSSGSTAWNNSVRSRIYLFRPVDGDPAIRILELKKSNRSAIGVQIPVRYSSGQFVRDDGSTAGATNKRHLAESVFISLLARLPDGVEVGHRSGPNYAPAYFAKSDLAKGIGKNELVLAMQRLLERGKIRVVQSGPRSRRTSHLEIVDAAEPEIDADRSAIDNY
jgi:RecA-family ATPase